MNESKEWRADAIGKVGVVGEIGRDESEANSEHIRALSTVMRHPSSDEIRAQAQAEFREHEKRMHLEGEIMGIERLHSRMQKSLTELPESKHLSAEFIRGFMTGCREEALGELSISALG